MCKLLGGQFQCTAFNVLVFGQVVFLGAVAVEDNLEGAIEGNPAVGNSMVGNNPVVGSPVVVGNPVVGNPAVGAGSTDGGCTPVFAVWAGSPEAAS